MPLTAKNVRERRIRRHRSIRKRVHGSAQRPRLNVFRSSANVYVQIIDDDTGQTLASASTTEKAIEAKGGKKSEQAQSAGRLLAERAKAKGIVRVVFDRGGYLYHGRVKAVADGARVAGLEF
jgi:large subunit ribosomal protein L18